MFFFIVFTLFLLLPAHGNSHKWEYICIIGNSQSLKMAQKVHSQTWMSLFPSFWYVWGGEDISHSTIKSNNKLRNFHVVNEFYYNLNNDSMDSSTPKLSWAQGIHFALQVVRSSETLLSRAYDCQYFFTHDDDLEFTLSPDISLTDYISEPFSNTISYGPKTLPDALVSILLRHQPAVAGFPWEVGDKKYSETMGELRKKYALEPVAPLTGFGE
jgi:hypothetical protein